VPLVVVAVLVVVSTAPSVALAGAIFTSRLAAWGGAGHFVEAYRDVLLTGSVLMLIGAVLSSSRGQTGASHGARRPMVAAAADQA